ncbi:hypothetical protein C2E23DRAFT_423451 [Lenzites betulinus]|nr:hypothetical protein C2E23DRAFT_423451 [Lenzites betulinus]
MYLLSFASLHRLLCTRVWPSLPRAPPSAVSLPLKTTGAGLYTLARRALALPLPLARLVCDSLLALCTIHPSPADGRVCAQSACARLAGRRCERRRSRARLSKVRTKHTTPRAARSYRKCSAQPRYVAPDSYARYVPSPSSPKTLRGVQTPPPVRSAGPPVSVARAVWSTYKSPYGRERMIGLQPRSDRSPGCRQPGPCTAGDVPEPSSHTCGTYQDVARGAPDVPRRCCTRAGGTKTAAAPAAAMEVSAALSEACGRRT